jgi:transcriptional accessory protein Tex/SPT6
MEPFSKLEKNARSYVVGIAFREMAWPPNMFERFLPQYATNENSASAKDFYTRNRGLIQSVLFPRLSEARQELDSVCHDLQERLSSIGSMLEVIRTKLCEQYLISETAIKQIKESREHY